MKPLGVLAEAAFAHPGAKCCCPNPPFTDAFLGDRVPKRTPMLECGNKGRLTRVDIGDYDQVDLSCASVNKTSEVQGKAP